MIKKDKEKGIALYMVLMLLSVFVTVVFTLTSISLSQIKVSQQAGDSVKALGVADSGVEQALYRIRKLGIVTDIGKTDLATDLSYTVDITVVGQTATIQSKGVFRNVRRSVEVKY